MGNPKPRKEPRDSGDPNAFQAAGGGLGWSVGGVPWFLLLYRGNELGSLSRRLSHLNPR